MNLSQTLDKLQSLANPDALPGMRRFGLTGENRLGIFVPKLGSLAKEIGTDNPIQVVLHPVNNWAVAAPFKILQRKLTR